jgi:hypothetical protein
MKIKELPKDTNLGGLKVKTPKGVVGFWKSQWQVGVWLSDGESSQVYPQFVNELEEVLEWEVNVDDGPNCHKLTDLEYIDNTKK